MKRKSKVVDIILIAVMVILAAVVYIQSEKIASSVSLEVPLDTSNDEYRLQCASYEGKYNPEILGKATSVSAIIRDKTKLEDNRSIWYSSDILYTLSTHGLSDNPTIYKTVLPYDDLKVGEMVIIYGDIIEYDKSRSEMGISTRIMEMYYE